MKQIAIVALVLSVAGVVAAKEARAPKVVACDQFSEFKSADGKVLGVCASAKEGGKPRLLRTYTIVKVQNPETGAAVSVMVGMQ